MQKSSATLSRLLVLITGKTQGYSEFLSDAWYKFSVGQVDIDDVVAEYDKYRFDVNQDAPGNLHWQELLAVSPKGTKVILTGRF